MDKMTVRDIAKIAQVSKSTVSRALNNSGYVKPDVKKQILDIARTSGYYPRKGKTLSNGRHAVVGVIFPDLDSNFFGKIVEGITYAADKNECGVMLFSSNNLIEKEMRSIRMLRDMDISGLIITPVSAYDAIEGWNRLLNELDILNIPVVFVDRTAKRSNWDSISYDNYNGAYLIGETLLNEGHESIGAIIGDLCLQLGYDRLNGFTQALELKHVNVDPNFYLTNEKIISADDAYSFTMQKIKAGKLPEAVFLSNSLIATGFIKAVFESGLVPGKDVRCIGFDYLEALDILNFDYSYLDRGTFETGKMAMEMLLERFDSSINSKREYVIPPQLIL